MKWCPLCIRPSHFLGNFIVLAHQYNSLDVDTLFWFRADQSLHLLLNAACLAEKQQIPNLKSLVYNDHGSNQRSTTLEVSILTITPLMRSHWCNGTCSMSNYENINNIQMHAICKIHTLKLHLWIRIYE